VASTARRRQTLRWDTGIKIALDVQAANLRRRLPQRREPDVQAAKERRNGGLPLSHPSSRRVDYWAQLTQRAATMTTKRSFDLQNEPNPSEYGAVTGNLRGIGLVLQSSYVSPAPFKDVR
jgi:hypothetical protein